MSLMDILWCAVPLIMKTSIREIPGIECVCVMDILQSAYRGISISAVDI